MLHLQWKAYAWWLFESSSLKGRNVSSYARFTRKLVERFDERHFKTSWGEQIKPNKSKSLHELEDSMEPTPVLNIVEGVENLLHLVPKAKAPTQQDLFSQREDLRIPSSLRGQGKGFLDDEAFSTNGEKGEKEQRRSSSTMQAGGDFFSNGDEAMASLRGILALLQGIILWCTIWETT